MPAIDQSSGVFFHLEQLLPHLRGRRLAPSQGAEQGSSLMVRTQHAAVYQTGLTQADLNISEPAWPRWQNRCIYFGIYCIYCRVTFAQLSRLPARFSFWLLPCSDALPARRAGSTGKPGAKAPPALCLACPGSWGLFPSSLIRVLTWLLPNSLEEASEGIRGKSHSSSICCLVTPVN